MSYSQAVSPFRGGLARITAREDFFSGVIMACAAGIFIGTTARTIKPALNALFYAGGGADQVALVALILNLALILFAWARHRDAKQQVKARLAAEQQSYLLRTRDLETELLNRNSLKTRGEALIEAAREQRGNVALLVVSLDRLKKMTESYGDSMGDAIVAVAARIILNASPKDALCARLRTDEFAIAIPFEDGAEEKIESFAEDISAQLNLPVEILGAAIQVKASIGLSSLGFDCTNFTNLLRRATSP